MHFMPTSEHLNTYALACASWFLRPFIFQKVDEDCTQMFEKNYLWV